MMSPSDYEKRLIAMVDSFTKTVARNFSRNLKRAKANREKHFSDEPVDYLLELLSHDDRYPSDHFVLHFAPCRRSSGRSYCLTSGEPSRMGKLQQEWR